MEGSIRKGYLFKAKRGIGVEPRGGAYPYKHLLSTPLSGGLICVRLSRMSLAFPWKQEGKKTGDKLKSYGFQCVNNLFVAGRNL